jgi:hypothetical protein
MMPLIPHHHHKLGKREATHDHRDLVFADFATFANLPNVPASFGYGRAVAEWGMLGNDRYGDCVFAGAGHETMLFAETTRGVAGMPRFDDENALLDYSIVTGFDETKTDPKTGENPTDQGTYVRDALDYRRQTGVVDAAGQRHKIAGYVALEPGNWEQLMQAAYIGLAVGIGIEFPESAMSQFDRGSVWSVVAGARIEGGHYIPVTGRTSLDNIGVITWGRRQGMTRAFYTKYCDEAWGLVPLDGLRSTGKNVRGFDTAALMSALESLS